jgi:hypothetical protein
MSTLSQNILEQKATDAIWPLSIYVAYKATHLRGQQD